MKCRDCRYGKFYGADKLRAEMRGTGHALKHPGHTVDLENHGETLRSFKQGDRALPFTEARAELVDHQTMLRDFVTRSLSEREGSKGSDG